jgi:hypothetical protein
MTKSKRQLCLRSNNIKVCSVACLTTLSQPNWSNNILVCDLCTEAVSSSDCVVSPVGLSLNDELEGSSY